MEMVKVEKEVKKEGFIRKGFKKVKESKVAKIIVGTVVVAGVAYIVKKVFIDGHEEVIEVVEAASDVIAQ